MDKRWMLLSLVLLNGCGHTNPNWECTKDSDCAIAGCSSQVCTSVDKSDDLITTCEYLEEYKCLELSNCGCVDNKCQWAENNEYNGCLEEVRA
jgi:eight-cysteine-cluster-containing protein